MPLATLAEQPRLAVCLDGADEIGPGLGLVKGLGGALLREKIVASAADRFVVVADASKRVARLGEHAPVPVEVIPFGEAVCARALRALGADPVPREGFVTDEGNRHPRLPVRAARRSRAAGGGDPLDPGRGRARPVPRHGRDAAYVGGADGVEVLRT